MDWADENLLLIDCPNFKDFIFQSREPFFPKERMEDFWDHLVTNLTSSQGNILSLYVVSRLIFFLSRILDLCIVSIVKTFQQEMYMNKFFQWLLTNPKKRCFMSIFTIFLILVCVSILCSFITNFFLFMYLAISVDDSEESSNRKKTSNHDKDGIEYSKIYI